MGAWVSRIRTVLARPRPQTCTVIDASPDEEGVFEFQLLDDPIGDDVKKIAAV